jgi:TRAP-type C4-dicarboxylate transport system permease small subunit
MDSHGNLTAIVARLPILKIQQNGERGRMIWTSYDLPLGALRSFIQHLENVLESARTRLAEIPEDE